MIRHKPMQQYLTGKICSLLEILWRVCADGVNTGFEISNIFGNFFIFAS